MGCGDELRGTINVDIKKPPFKPWKPFILANGQNLPFQNDIFSETLCHHVIEHVDDPFKLIDELLRVTKHKVTLTCPFRFSGYAKAPDHKHQFNKTWFRKVLERKNVHFKVHINLDNNRDLIGYALPLEITV